MPFSGSHSVDGETTQDLSAVAATPRRRRPAPGIWYVLLTVFSLGFLSALPFIHAWLVLRRRWLLFVGIVYFCLSAVLFNLHRVFPGAGDGQYETVATIAGLSFISSLGLACVMLARLRAEVYGVTVAPERRKAAAETMRESFAMLAVLSGVVSVVLVAPPLLIREMISTTGWSYYGESTVNAIATAVIALVLMIAIAVALNFLLDPKRSIAVYLLWLWGSVVANTYLAFTVWIVATKWARVDVADSDARQIALLVLWNVLDSIPLLDIDAMLDWEQPLEEYGAGLGWLLLVQRVFLLVTLARAVQFLVERIVAVRRAEPAVAAAGGGGTLAP